MSSCLDPDQDQHSVGPDLGPNCLQGLPADKSGVAREELKTYAAISYAHHFCLGKSLKNVYSSCLSTIYEFGEIQFPDTHMSD